VNGEPSSSTGTTSSTRSLSPASTWISSPGLIRVSRLAELVPVGGVDPVPEHPTSSSWGRTASASLSCASLAGEIALVGRASPFARLKAPSQERRGQCRYQSYAREVRRPHRCGNRVRRRVRGRLRAAASLAIARDRLVTPGDRRPETATAKGAADAAAASGLVVAPARNPSEPRPSDAAA
jgi:hypothetical protein